MVDRGFSEVDLRLMLDGATRFRQDIERGRYVVETKHLSKTWEVIVEPDVSERLLVVITAYPVEEL
jgi:hypothetical protein